MYRIFMAPVQQADTLTLMADADTWRAVSDRIARDDLNRYAALDAAMKQASGETFRRVTLPEELARYVLGIAGVSA